MRLQELHALIEQNAGFLASSEDYETARAVILGVPMDYTVSFRPGSRLGPERIREVSYGIEEYSFYLDKSLLERNYYDAGDLALPVGNVAGSLEMVRAGIRHILADGKVPFALGGEHLVSWPIIEAMAEKYPNLAVVHFDAHADLRHDYLGEKFSHATVMRRVAELIGPKNLYQFGIRSGTREERQFAEGHTNTFFNQIHPALSQVMPELRKRPVYISLDIDVVDPAFAPGTGTPEPGGCTSWEIIQAIHHLGSCKVVGFDLVEISPSFDLAQITAVLGAKILREAILSFIPA
ncbi:MAG: agmatinase [Peptococcaceae bacterium]|nr:agmatinase [Peptococcaceae bacterium]